MLFPSLLCCSTLVKSSHPPIDASSTFATHSLQPDDLPPCPVKPVFSSACGEMPRSRYRCKLCRNVLSSNASLNLLARLRQDPYHERFASSGCTLVHISQLSRCIREARRNLKTPVPFSFRFAVCPGKQEARQYSSRSLATALAGSERVSNFRLATQRPFCVGACIAGFPQ